jgi:hypothetical protein
MTWPADPDSWVAQKRLTLEDADFIMKLDEVGYSNSEIARKLGVTEGAIRYRIKRRASGKPDGRTGKSSELDGFREWIGAWIADYEDAPRRPTLRLLELEPAVDLVPQISFDHVTSRRDRREQA